jgi:hypothetical protein
MASEKYDGKHCGGCDPWNTASLARTARPQYYGEMAVHQVRTYIKWSQETLRTHVDLVCNCRELTQRTRELMQVLKSQANKLAS